MPTPSKSHNLCDAPLDDLHQIAAATPEDEEISGMGISVKAFLDLECEALHPAAHICMARGEPDPDTRGDRDHRSARNVAVTRGAGADAPR